MFFGGRFADANAQSGELLRAEHTRNRTQSIMSRQASAHFDLQSAGLEVQLIVRDNEMSEIRE
jgi:hypothetical protein